MLTILPAKRKPSVASAALCLARGARQRLLLCFLLLCAVTQIATAQFVHPGGVHTQADLDRMKAKVAANAYPWINGWNLLIADSKAQKTYVARPSANIGGSGIRQQAAKDATAAYFNTLRWYISGDTAYANCAVRILNAWSGSINQVVSGELFQLPIMMMVQAGELLRMYPGWAAADFTRFKNMCLNYFYPACHNFLGGCGSWPGWDGPANACILYIGILCDDQAKFDEAVNYYKTGNGGGSVTKAIWQTSGQITEMGRDQPHAEIGPTVMAEMCQSAWNQGVDLFSYADNRLLAGFEYFCKFNLNHAVDWVSYNDCDNHNFYYPAYRFENRISQAPAYELVYNHYVVKQGLSAPYTRAMINLRGLAATGGEYSGYCALTYTLSDTTTLFQPRPVPAAPTGLTAMAGVSNVVLKWTGPAGDVANGYNVLRSTTAGGPYTTIASWGGSDPAKGYITSSYYTDTAVTSGTTYYYRVAANNQSGSSGNSAEASATPVSGGTALPVGWTMRDIGSVATAGSATYADANSKTFVLKASGNSFGGSNDSYGYVYTSVTGDFSLTTKVFDVRLSASNADRVGLVMRESFTANAAMASIGLADNGFRQVWFASHATGGSTTWKGGHSHTGIPVWFKLERSGNTFTGYQSVDGATWFSVGSTTIAMPTTYYVGMYVNSGSTTAGVTTTATFDHVTTVGGGTTAPAAPTGLTAAVGNTQAALSWSAVNSAACYNVKRATNSGGPYATVATGITTTSYTDTGLVNGTTYYYVVAAANLAGEGVNSNEASVTPVLSIAPVPTAVTATSLTATQINLSWSSSLSAVTYNVKRATVSGGPYTTVASVATTSYSDTALTTDTTYYYVVSAINAKGESANSTQVKAIPGRVSYWKFDETSGTTATDTWSGNKGTLSSGVTWASGAINNGIKMDGTANAYVTLPSGLVSVLNDFTVSAWVKMEAAANWARIFDFGSGTGKYMFLGRNNNGYLRYAITSGSGEQGINSNKSIPIGSWMHVAVTWSGDTGIMYMNGVEVGRNNNMTLRPSSLGSTTQNYIGKSQWPNDPLLTGTLDEFQIYNRALSVSEVSTLSQLSVPPTAPPSLSVTVGNNQASLNWTAPAGATSYNVKRATSASGPFNGITSVTATSYVDTTAYNCSTYYYVVSAVNSKGEGLNSPVVGMAAVKKLTGTLLGTEGSWGNNAATTKAAAVDGSLNSFFDAPTGTAWVGYDLGADSGYAVNRVRYAPRAGKEGRMVGGMFQGSNVADFSTATTLFTVTAQPTAGVYTEQTIANTTPFRYIRYISPSTGFGNVSEVEFHGVLSAAPQMLSKAGIQTTTLGAPFSYTILASNRPKQYSAAGLPDGVSLNTCTGIIAGTATVAGNFTVILTAANDRGAALDTLTLLINKQEQLITFNALADKQVGDADFEAGAIASSGLSVAYGSSNESVATIVESKIHIVGTGTTIISAIQAGNENYNAAPVVTQTLTVYKTYYVDADGDGFGFGEAIQFATEATPAGYAVNNTDCDDSKLLYADQDGDGLGAGAPVACGVSNNTDCDDTNPVQLTASIADVYALNPAVDAKNTLYIGYGPTTLTITASPTGGTAPYSYLWSSGEATQAISASAAGTYSVTTTDAKGCTTVASITISTLDVRCGNNNDKVKICHNARTICIASTDVQDHLNHGDYLGGCNTSSIALGREGSVLEETADNNVVLYPNPASEVLNIRVSKLEAGASVQVYNQSGALVLSQRLTTATQAISMKGLAAGLYYVQIRNGGQLTTEKVVKQ